MKTKIVAEVIPCSTVKLAATKRGWKADSDVSPTDYVEPEAYASETMFISLDKAVEHCVQHIKSGDSFWGAEYVTKYERRPDPYIRGRVEWVRIEFWVVSNEGIDYHENCEVEAE